MLKRKKIYLVTALGFLVKIFLGAILLGMPICNNRNLKFSDAIFISTSAVCVNGYTVQTISEQFTGFGQFILLLLVQIGALGFMSFIVFILTITNKKIRISDTVIAGDSINENIYSHIRTRIKNIFKYTFGIEGLGAIFLSLRFIQIYGLKQGVWYGIFHSITAFCNAGFDILPGENSLLALKNDVYINSILIMLMFLGGIGFLVIEDVISCFSFKKNKKLSFQSRLVLKTTFVLIFFSLILTKIFEPNLKFLENLFMGITLRTTGFSIASVANFQNTTKLLYCILMLIGGAPGSTSGGIRESVVAILFLVVSSTLRKKKEVTCFYRRIDDSVIKKSITIVILSALIILIGTMIIMNSEHLGLEDTLFHTIGAFSEVGLSYIDFNSFSEFGQIVIMVIMYIGRIGPISAASLLVIDKKERQDISYPNANVIL